MISRVMIPALFIVLATCAQGCGSGSCNQDTDCKFPQICVFGTCTDKYPPPDAAPDTPYDFSDWQETPPDPVETDFEVKYDVTDEGPGEIDLEVVEEDVEEEELPPATVLWSEDFSAAPTRWTTQFGSWSVNGGGEYEQSSSSIYAEAWVETESWDNFAVEASVIADSFDATFTRPAFGILFRVQGIETNHYYLCGIDFKSNKLLLVSYNQDVPPGYSDLCIYENLDPALVTGTWYNLQAVVDNTSLTCRWVVEGEAKVQISAQDATYDSGSIGLLANHVAGRFDNVTVYDHRPPEWPRAAIRNACP
jgi:hypothetical protein